MKRAFIIALFLINICFFSLTYAEIYQWTDEDGVIHFSNDNVVYKTEGVTRTGEIISSPDLPPLEPSQKSNDESEVVKGTPKQPIIINGPTRQERFDAEERAREKHEIYMEREKQQLENDRVRTEAIKQLSDQQRKRNHIPR